MDVAHGVSGFGSRGQWLWLTGSVDVAHGPQSTGLIAVAHIVHGFFSKTLVLLWHIFIKLHDTHQAVVQSVMSGFRSLVS